MALAGEPVGATAVHAHQSPHIPKLPLGHWWQARSAANRLLSCLQTTGQHRRAPRGLSRGGRRGRLRDRLYTLEGVNATHERWVVNLINGELKTREVRGRSLAELIDSSSF